MDLYTTIHKGLRRAMFSAAQEVARTDFTEAALTDRTVETVRYLFGLLDEHASHEDRVLMPEIAKIGPAVFADLQADHNRVGGMQREIEQHLGRLAAATGDERLSLGQRLHEKMGRLVSEHLMHMDREETTAMRLLWAHRTDEELKALHGRILGAIPVDRMCEWAGILLPAVTPQERAGMMAGLQFLYPPEEFAKLLAIADGARSHSEGASALAGIDG
jgi:hypothetical protein